MDFDKIVNNLDSFFKDLDDNLRKEVAKIYENEKEEEYIEFDKAYDITKKKVDEIWKSKKDKEVFKEILAFIFTEYFFKKTIEEENNFKDDKPKYLN